MTTLPWLEDTLAQFSGALSRGRLGHAVLLTGPAGVGKFRLADTLIATLLCRRRTDAAATALPCGVCDACTQCAESQHPDVHTVEADEKTGSISVAAVRDVCTKLQMTSQMTGYRVGLFPNADRCTESAANSLLKTLEEPPADVVMLLVTARPGRLPATIRSRCQTWRCALPPNEVAEAWLRTQGVADPATALRHAGGAPLAALEENSGALDAALGPLLEGVVTGRTAVADAARQLEGFGADAVLAACVGVLDRVLINRVDDLSAGLQIACFGAEKTARHLFAWRDVAVREYARNRTGLNDLATLERVLSAGREDAAVVMAT
ncbi:MAG: DNA polymerase III subunit delta' [Pseudomonadota bacterium]